MILLSNCGELSEYDNRQIAKALGDSLLNTTESWGVKMNLIENGEIFLTLTGTYTNSINESDVQRTEISGPVYIEIFEEPGVLQTTVHSDSAVYFPEEKVFDMFGSVQVETSDGNQLFSEYLKWEREKDQISTPAFVIFISPPDSIAANGFFGDTDLTNYTLNEGGGRTVIN